MKKTALKIALACAALFLIGTAYAHDPSEHHGKREAPDCSAMKDMDHMDKTDPVMMAMMQQCADEHEDEEHEHHHGDKEDHDDDHEDGDQDHHQH